MYKKPGHLQGRALYATIKRILSEGRVKKMADLFRSKGLKCLLTALLTLSLALAFCALPGLAVRAEAGSAAGAQWRDIKDVIAGEGFTVALREDGKVLYAGDDFSGVGQRIRSWDGIERIELQGWQSYLVGYREDGSLRLEALLDREQYGYSDLWSEKDLASWSGVEQLYLDYGVCLGLTRAGRVLAISRDPEYDGLCRELSSWRGIRQLGDVGYGLVLGLREDGTVTCAAIDDEIGNGARAFWADRNAPKHIRDLVPGAYGLYVIDENGTVVYGLFGQVWTNIDRLYFASDSMFGLRRDGTVAVDQEASRWDDRIARVGEWTHIKELGFDITGIARYVPVGLREDGTVCAITEYEDGEPYGWWDFTGWRDVQKLFSGTDCTVGVRSDGSVLVTGGEFGALDFQDEIARWKDIRAIYFAVGEFTDHVVGLKTDGTLVAAGDNSLGQCNVTG